MELLSYGDLRRRRLVSLPHCGYVLTLDGADTLTDCPGCGGSDFVRASLFSAEPTRRVEPTARHGGELVRARAADRDAQLASARAQHRAAGRVPRASRRAASCASSR